MLCFNVNLKIRFIFEFGNTKRKMEILWMPMVVMLRKLIKLKENLAWSLSSSGSIFTSLTSTISTESGEDFYERIDHEKKCSFLSI